VNDTPPNDVAAEASVLGAMMLDARVIDEVTEVVTGQDFYRPAHESIFEAILDARRHGDRPDMLVVAARLGAELHRMGGAAYLHTVVTNTPVTANAAFYARRVADMALKRRLADAGTKIRQQAYSDEIDAATAAEDARRTVDEAAQAQVAAEAGVGAAELLEETIEALERAADEGLSTGWSDLDEHVNGLRPGQLWLIGARPSVGKSVIAANLAAAVCKTGIGVHFASLEMTRAEVMNRILSAQASVALDRLMAHRLDDSDWDRIAQRAAEVGAWPLWVDETESQSLLHLRSRARTTSRRTRLGLVIVDYLQLMSPRDRRVNREQQVGELSEGLKSMAKELAVPVVALAQLNRGPMERHDKRPLISDLRESGRLEADADGVLLLHRQDLVDRDSMTGELEVHVAKNRNGRAGATVTLMFQGHYSRAVQRAWSPSEVLR